MRINDARPGLRVKTPNGLATVTGTVTSVRGKRYIDVEHDDRVPGRPNMDDRRGSYSPRSVSLPTETA